MNAIFRICLIAGLAAGCGANSTVVRTDQELDLSGEWNDVDADSVARSMITDCLGSRWADNFRSGKSRNPVIKLYPIRNRSSDHIESKYFTKQVERALLNSGNVEITAASDESDDTRAEQRDQAHHASDATAKSAGNETGADFILNGWVISQDDTDGKGQVLKAFVTTMELVDVESQRKVWMGEKKIKKLVQRASVGF